MLNTVLGTKSEMAQTFKDGKRLSVTKVKAGPCVVTAIKNKEKDGYWVVQLGLGQRKIKNITKPLQGHLKKVIKNKKAPRFLREVRLEDKPDLNVGDKILLSDIFVVGDKVAATAVSKSKGFAGVVKRWHFAGGPKTHGQSDRPRSPGAIGQGTTPGRVFKGKKMAGRMGGKRTTVKNLQVVAIDPEKQELELSGPIPGPKGSLVIIRKIGKAKNA
jgi:large subunit ribosomal protein L3